MCCLVSNLFHGAPNQTKAGVNALVLSNIATDGITAIPDFELFRLKILGQTLIRKRSIELDRVKLKVT
jgi:hypothetical protein